MINFQFECVESDLTTPTSSFGRFVFRPLDPGEGITIANMLRRVLICGLYGLRISGLRIAGVNNEFASIGGVREDILEIILNLKEVIFRSSVPESTYARFRVQGPAVICANSLQLPKHIEIVNPFAHILTISDNSIVEFEVKLEWGKSYALATDQMIDGPSDYIPIDANFMPVQKVSFFIQPVPSKAGTKSKKEQLFLDVWTNGSLKPTEAIFSATNVIINWVLSIQSAHLLKYKKSLNQQKKRFLQNKGKSTEDKKNKSILEKDKTLGQKLFIPIEKLDLSTRAYKGLKSAGIDSIEDLKHSSIKELKKIKNFGRKSLEEIRHKLNTLYKITLK